MKNFKVLQSRLGLLVLISLILVIISTLTRISFLIKSSQEVDFTILNLVYVFLIGWFYDLVNAAYFIIPFSIYLWLVPTRVFTKPWHRFILYAQFLFFISFLIFNAVSEWFFWDEFSTRFNFIAVDYLVYSTEVIGNVRQSYPMEWIIAGVLAVALVSTYLLKSSIKNSIQIPVSFKQRSKYMVLFLVLLVLIFNTVSINLHKFSDNTYVNELAGNGLYELFAAYRNNELNYDQFYAKIPDEEASDILRREIKTREATFNEDAKSIIERRIANEGAEEQLNVIMISIESFSADFMGAFGNTKNLTPHLDSLSKYSLLFTNLYATGTRTVRGLEALSLCVPPTPGQSIVRRPNNENLFSLGEVFGGKGYESKYIYGGYGYFDNMNYFFENNGYEVVDRTALKDEDIDHENIWGVADENLFSLAMKEIDKTTNQNKPVFAQIMTTSNHRPYTYPEGRIDIPSHTGREGAVKYTDYAIGKFIRDARLKPWFSKTIFVIVADHCASSAGKTELPIEKYHIPMLIYSPAHVKPGEMKRLMSQIDIGPTLLGMLNFSYTSKFFGYDMFKLEEGRERAFISTYQKLGFIKDGLMVILSPQKESEVVVLKENGMVNNDSISNDQIVKEAISWYQYASYMFSNGLMKNTNRNSNAIGK